MENGKQKITLKIAGKSYSMGIDPAKEEVYRLAERELNNQIALYEQKRLDGYATHDYLAVIALQLAVSVIRNKQSRELGSTELQGIAELVESIEAYLNK